MFAIFVFDFFPLVFHLVITNAMQHHETILDTNVSKDSDNILVGRTYVGFLFDKFFILFNKETGEPRIFYHKPDGQSSFALWLALEEQIKDSSNKQCRMARNPLPVTYSEYNYFKPPLYIIDRSLEIRAVRLEDLQDDKAALVELPQCFSKSPYFTQIFENVKCLYGKHIHSKELKLTICLVSSIADPMVLALLQSHHSGAIIVPILTTPIATVLNAIQGTPYVLVAFNTDPAIRKLLKDSGYLGRVTWI